MKLFIATVVLAFVAVAQSLTDEQKEKLVAHHKECLPSSGVSEDLVKKMRAGEFTEDDKLKEYVRCMFVKVGFMNEAGEVQLDVIKAKIPDDVDKAEATKVIESCKEQKGTNAAGTAYLMYQCYRKTAATPITL